MVSDRPHLRSGRLILMLEISRYFMLQEQRKNGGFSALIDTILPLFRITGKTLLKPLKRSNKFPWIFQHNSGRKICRTILRESPAGLPLRRRQTAPENGRKFGRLSCSCNRSGVPIENKSQKATRRKRGLWKDV